MAMPTACSSSVRRAQLQGGDMVTALVAQSLLQKARRLDYSLQPNQFAERTRSDHERMAVVRFGHASGTRLSRLRCARTTRSSGASIPDTSIFATTGTRIPV